MAKDAIVAAVRLELISSLRPVGNLETFDSAEVGIAGRKCGIERAGGRGDPEIVFVQRLLLFTITLSCAAAASKDLFGDIPNPFGNGAARCCPNFGQHQHSAFSIQHSAFSS